MNDEPSAPLSSDMSSRLEEEEEEEEEEKEGTNITVSVRQDEVMEFPMEADAPIVLLTPTHNHSSHQKGGLFFADALLDLDEAQDFAETPKPPKLVMESPSEANTATAVDHIELPNWNSPSSRSISGSSHHSQSQTQTQIHSNNQNQNLHKNTTNGVEVPMQRIEATSVYQRQSLPTNHRPRPPRRPRDIPWLVAFILFVPISLVIPASLRHRIDYGSPLALNHVTERAILYAMILAFVGTLVLARFLYRTAAGGEGDDARYLVSQLIMAFAPISLGLHPLFMILIYQKTPTAIHYALIPLYFFIRDIWAMRQWRTTASTAGGRQAFFQALVSAALDILSRSLRRSSFYRIVIIILTFQFILVWWWQSALLGALGHGSTMWFLIALLAGKWATGTLARILGLIASGGVTSWFVQQSLLMEEMDQQAEPLGPTQSRNINMPEEYRTAEASDYQPVVTMGWNDDNNDDDDDFENGQVSLATMTILWEDTGSSTVKAFLISALTISFGSVAQCGLLGGLAQFVWSVLRNLEGLNSALSQRFPSQYRGFRGMPIGQEGVASTWMLTCISQAQITARNFVRSHSDLAMCQVASYYKSYQRAAQDVAILVDGSGVEPILHDDISTHMCACLCGSIAGMIIIFFGLILDHHQIADHLSDKTVVQSMLLAFVLCYVMLFTVMEPLRAAIKAIYVCFAQHPESLSQAFPLIFHRLTRISEANLV